MTKKNQSRVEPLAAGSDGQDLPRPATGVQSSSVPEKHTPGPWKVVGPAGYVYTVGNPYGSGEMHVAQVRGWGHLTGHGGGCAFDEDKAIAIQEANAQLIAAAPELLAAVKELGLRFGALVLASGDVSDINARVIDQANAAIAKAEGR